MLIFNDTFTWKGPPADTGNLWLQSCHLWIIDRTPANDKIHFLKPVIVIAQDQSKGPKRKICAETIGKQIFAAFNLNIKRTIWVEYDPDTHYKFMVALFTPKYHDGSEMIYSIQWRRASEEEREIISEHIPEIC